MSFWKVVGQQDYTMENRVVIQSTGIQVFRVFEITPLERRILFLDVERGVSRLDHHW